jgi:hypothetical protein
VPRAGGKIGITLTFPAAALTADEMPMLRLVNKDHIVPELQLLECLYRLMIAADAEANAQ